MCLTILPLGVPNGHADEYSKLVFGRITGCSPITPMPLLIKSMVIHILSSIFGSFNIRKQENKTKEEYNQKLTEHSQFSH